MRSSSPRGDLRRHLASGGVIDGTLIFSARRIQGRLFNGEKNPYVRTLAREGRVTSRAGSPGYDLERMNPQTTPTQTTRLTRRATSAAEEEATPSADATPVPTRPAKRARLHVAPSESTQVSTLADFRLPLLDADCFFVPDLVSDAIAQNWYDGLVGIEGCESLYAGAGGELMRWTGYQPKLKMYGKEITQSRKIAGELDAPRSLG